MYGSDNGKAFPNSKWISAEDLFTEGSSDEESERNGDLHRSQDQPHNKKKSLKPNVTRPENSSGADNSKVPPISTENQFGGERISEEGMDLTGRASRAKLTIISMDSIDCANGTNGCSSDECHLDTMEDKEICWKPKRGNSFKAHQEMMEKVLKNFT